MYLWGLKWSTPIILIEYFDFTNKGKNSSGSPEWVKSLTKERKSQGCQNSQLQTQGKDDTVIQWWR